MVAVSSFGLSKLPALQVGSSKSDLFFVPLFIEQKGSSLSSCRKPVFEPPQKDICLMEEFDFAGKEFEKKNKRKVEFAYPRLPVFFPTRFFFFFLSCFHFVFQATRVESAILCKGCVFFLLVSLSLSLSLSFVGFA